MARVLFTPTNLLRAQDRLSSIRFCSRAAPLLFEARVHSFKDPKTMRLTTYFAAVSFFFLPCIAVAQTGVQDGAARIVPHEVFFTAGMTKADLDRIKADERALGIDLEYGDLKWDEAGGLVGLGIKVKGEGANGSASVEALEANKQFGYHIDRSAKAEMPFSIGVLYVDGQPTWRPRMAPVVRPSSGG